MSGSDFMHQPCYTRSQRAGMEIRKSCLIASVSLSASLQGPHVVARTGVLLELLSETAFYTPNSNKKLKGP